MVRKPRQQRKNPDKYAVSTNVPARGKEAAGTSRLGQRQSIGVHNVLLSVQSPREDCGLVNPHQRVDSLFSSAGNGSQSQSPHPPSTLSSFAYDPVIGSSKSTLHPGTQPQLSNYVDSLYGGEGYDSVCDAGNSDPTAARTAALALIYNRSQYATSFDSGLYASDHFRSMPQACTNLQHVGEPDNNFPGHGVEDPTPRFGCGEEFAWPLIDQALISWMHHMESRGGLPAGSASASLDVLSKCEAARSLWQLNLNYFMPWMVPYPGSPRDIYAQAQACLKQMTPAQGLSDESFLIRWAVAEYKAIAFVQAVQTLQRDICASRQLNIPATGAAIGSQYLSGFLEGVQSICDLHQQDQADVA